MPLFFHLSAFFWRLANPANQLTDSAEYLISAQNIANGSWFFGNPIADYNLAEIYSKRLLLYPLFIAIISAVQDSFFWIYLYQAVLSFFTCLIVLRMAVLLNIGKTGHAVMALAASFFPAQYIYANLLMSELLFQYLLTAALYQVLKYNFAANSQQAKSALWYWHLLLCLCLLTKPVMSFFWVLNIAFMIFLWPKANPTWRLSNQFKRAVFIGPLLLPAVILILCFNNMHRTGYFHYSAIKEVNLLYYNANYLLQHTEPAQADAYIDSARAQAERQPSFAARQQYMGAKAMVVLKKYPLQYAAFHLKGCLNFFLDPGRFDIYNFLGPEITGSDSEGFLNRFSKEGYKGIWNYLLQQHFTLVFILLLSALAGLVTLAGFIAFVFLRNVPAPFKVALVIIVLYIAGVTGPFGAARFKLPVWPLLVLATGISADAWAKRKDKR
ncbi:MAG: hypothetical protein V4543_08660 [Bacteroidota bacterium]